MTKWPETQVEVDHRDGSIDLVRDGDCWAPAMSRDWRYDEADRIHAVARRRVMWLDVGVSLVRWMAFYAGVIFCDGGFMGDAALIWMFGYLPVKVARPCWRAALDSVPKAWRPSGVADV